MLETSINLIPNNLSVQQYFQKTYLVQLEFFFISLHKEKKLYWGLNFNIGETLNSYTNIYGFSYEDL